MAAQSVAIMYQELFLDYDSDDEDSDEDLPIKKRKTVPARIKFFVEHTIPRFSDIEFQMHFRVTNRAFEWLLNTLGLELQSKRFSGRQTIDARKQLLAILWLLATPDSYR